MARKTASSIGVRVNYGTRAPIKHYVSRHRLQEVAGGPRGGILVPFGSGEAATVFPTQRCALRAVKRTNEFFLSRGETAPEFTIRPVR